MQILTSGSLAYDRIMDFPGKFSDHILPDKIHVLNVSFMVNGLTERCGGTAGNIAYNLALLGEKPIVLATAGKDFDTYKRRMIQLGLPLDGIREIPEEFTAGAYITTDMSDNQITGFNPGAMKYPSLFQFDGIQRDDAVAIISPGNLEDMIQYSRYYKKAGISHIVDPGQQIVSLTGDELEEMITGSSMFVSNDYELEMVLKTTSLKKRDMLKKTQAIITTLAEKGSVILTSDGELNISAVEPETVIDPTGAGDAFRAGLIKGLVMKKDLSVCAQMGAVCASFAVEHYGTQEHHFTLESFWKRYEKAFQDYK
ncbi:MAG: carbohydrate kinase family protein [Deltaproteobacteria bacterium]|nr:carbohydrate kinase family protein [Deltaproteobacteria bacterium]MBW1963219.1 carbohydrate kinase family protein [Deltaproteobacteria bacterium]MBW1993350.1 carbohydrate kinase family protein [Deltaproteobacteria bacterium]MBW2150248.1 carbohydrate kinase family protein [Deltaproteobacteria bacterium]